jgi:CheY-like chemotaxis protein
MPAPTVLIVDDEPNLVDLVKSYLERERFAVATAADGPSAIDAARTLKRREASDVSVLITNWSEAARPPLASTTGRVPWYWPLAERARVHAR